MTCFTICKLRLLRGFSSYRVDEDAQRGRCYRGVTPLLGRSLPLRLAAQRMTIPKVRMPAAPAAPDKTSLRLGYATSALHVHPSMHVGAFEDPHSPMPQVQTIHHSLPTESFQYWSLTLLLPCDGLTLNNWSPFTPECHVFNRRSKVVNATSRQELPFTVNCTAHQLKCDPTSFSSLELKEKWADA